MRSHWTALVQAEVQWAVHILSSQLWDQQNQQCLTYPVCSIRMSQSLNTAGSPVVPSEMQLFACLHGDSLLLTEQECCHFHCGCCQKHFRHTHSSSSLSSLIGVRELFLIYLGHACCDKRAIFCGSQPPWIQRRTRWMQAHQALKSVWYLEQLMTGGARSPGEAARRQLFRAQEVHVDGITSAHQPNVCVCVFVPACQFCFPARACCFHFPLILEFRRTQVLLGF